MQRVQEWMIGVSLFVLLLWSAAVARGDDGFTERLNEARVSQGLAPVGTSAVGENVSYTNNVQQRSRGLGHWYVGSYGQCAAVGANNAEQALRMWAGSPAHASLIFSPSLTAVGFACDGWCASVACIFGNTQFYPVRQEPMMGMMPTEIPAEMGIRRGHHVGNFGSVAPTQQTTQPVPFCSSVIDRPSITNCQTYGTGWCGRRGFRLFGRRR